MGVRVDIDQVTDADVEALVAADELLSKVLSDFARDRFREANEQNRKAVGFYVPHTVEVNGKKYAGRGEILTALPPVVMERGTALETKIVFVWSWGAIARLLPRPLRAAIKVANIQIVESVAEELVPRLAKFVGRRVLRGDRADERDDDPILWIAQELLDRSPVETGRYRAAHTLLANGAEIASAEDLLAGQTELPDADEFVFINTVEYARKIEVGVTHDGRDFVVQVPNRIYERTAMDAAAIFREDATVLFEFRDAAGGAAPTTASGRPLRFPAIIVRLK